ncbi:MAG: amidohydrolase [Desulfobacterales bacterium]|nr:amidohydrolase [Desulfobacterales bacterium]MDD4071098.1 amidohydrolase [Desulfobacterales bacterium]MDD4392133.1 amidohydrolase [Desulfobacterales bacterium]
MPFDLVIHNGQIVTVNPGFEIIGNGCICISGGKLVQVGPEPEGFSPPEAAQVIDAAGGIVMPGLVNTHTHLPMTLFRGLADDLPLMQWLNEHIFPAEARFIHPENVKWASRLACAEMLLSGTTCCCDGYFLEHEVAEAVVESGMRAVLGQGVIDFPAPGVADPKENILAAVHFTDTWRSRSSLIRPSIFCHSPYTCTEQTLKTAKQAADENGVLFQIHVAETRGEVDRSYADHGISPIAYLDRIGILDEKTLLVHAVWISDGDIDIIARTGARVSHNPESNMKLASGISPLPKLIGAGICVGLGTDGCASNNDLDLLHEMDLTAKLHKVSTLDPVAADARTVLTMATAGGAKAIGLGRETGSLEIGKQADVMILDMAKPHLVPMYHPESHIVYAAKGSDVRDVIVGGRVLVRNRQVLTLDVEEIMENVNRIAGAIRAEGKEEDGVLRTGD